MLNQKGQQLFAYGQKPGKKRFIPNSGFLNQVGQGSGVFQLLISAVVAMAILGVLLGILGIITPPGQDIAVIARDNISQAFTKQGVLITSGKINIAKGASITNTVGGPELGIPDTQIGTASDSTIAGLTNTDGVLLYNGSSSLAVRVRAYCYWLSQDIETKITDLGIGLDTISWPSGTAPPIDTVACVVGITKG